jgi:carotenoid cleavage dioxygenase-like enzyme
LQNELTAAPPFTLDPCIAAVRIARDGAGMVHGVRLHGGAAAPTYSARYVSTTRLQEVRLAAHQLAMLVLHAVLPT